MGCLKLTFPELQLHLLCDTWYFGSLDLLSFWKTLEEAFVIAYLINCFYHLFLNLGPDVVLIKNEVRRVYVLEQHQLEVPIRWHIHDPSGEFPNSLSLLACHFLWVSIVCMAVEGLAIILCKHQLGRRSDARISTTICSLWHPKFSFADHFEDLVSDEWILKWWQQIVISNASIVEGLFAVDYMLQLI